MTGKAIGEDEISHLTVRARNDIMIERVERVVTGPEIDQLDRPPLGRRLRDLVGEGQDFQTMDCTSHLCALVVKFALDLSAFTVASSILLKNQFLLKTLLPRPQQP